MRYEAESSVLPGLDEQWATGDASSLAWALWRTGRAEEVRAAWDGWAAGSWALEADCQWGRTHATGGVVACSVDAQGGSSRKWRGS